jgi:hypothetical protein
VHSDRRLGYIGVVLSCEGALVDKVRLATETEVATIRDTSVLTDRSSVFAFGDADPDLAVFRYQMELDPVYFAATTDNRRKAMFIWALENGLRMMGTVPHYCFNVAADDTTWQKVVENWGAERLHDTPQFRYIKKV